MEEPKGEEPKTPESLPIQIRHSPRFPAWLQGLHLSLAFTTYQTSRLFLIGLNPEGRISVLERLYERAMGLWAGAQTLYLSTRHQVWRFENTLAPGRHYRGYDRLYVPRVSYYTGDLDVHDLAVEEDGRLVLVNTRYSCLATLSEKYSFRSLWRPPFISQLVPEDRCHLNGLALVDGRAKYVTAVSRTDNSQGWRGHRRDGGVVIDVTDDRIVAEGLSMPHSPRVYQDRLWILNSGAGELGWVDPDQGRFIPLTFCPGYLRGLAFFSRHAVVGLSKPRHNKTFSGLALDDRLQERGLAPFCGLMVIDLFTGDIAHWLELEGLVTELYDVQVLPLVRRPLALGLKTDEIKRIITIQPEGEGEAGTLDELTVLEPEQAAASTSWQFLLLESLDREQALALDAFSFPSLRERWSLTPPQGRLVAVTALAEDQTLGAALAEIGPRGVKAEVLSLFVAPLKREQGLGSALLARLETLVKAAGCEIMLILYRSDWPARAFLE
ncbi:MAG: TIGR03032 family protein, partial [Thermodesulfobacteriota bacterium]